jgi:predicted MFS family arabinose efflux permease
VPAALSHLGMVFADNVIQIIALRSLTGVGYALATIAAMEYILDRIPSDKRAKGIGVFIAVIIGGTFAGTALGGILADRLGYDVVFMISLGLVMLAGVLGLRVMRQRTPVKGDGAEPFTMRDIVVVLKQPSLVLLMAGVTIPMNVLMAAFLWYLVPLTMASVGSSASEIARALMVYYLVILLGGPLVTKVAERRVGNWVLVGVGSVVSGAVLLLPALSPSALTVSLAVLVAGIGHAAVRGPQIALALDIADTEFPEAGRGPILGAMRSLERLGSLAGLLFAAMLAARFDLTVAIGAIGVAGAVAGLIYLVARPLVRSKEGADA